MKCSFSRPRLTVLTRLAASNIPRCCVADCRAMSRFSQSWPSVCPFFSQRRSSSFLRVGSPSALKTLSAFEKYVFETLHRCYARYPGGSRTKGQRVSRLWLGEVRIKVQACGICHSDVLTKEGAWPGIQYPRVPGHEVAGIIDEVGDGVSEWKKDSASAWAGMAARTIRASHAGGEISAIART